MSRFLAIPGMGTVYGFFQATMHDDEKSSLWQREWAYQNRTPSTRVQFGQGVQSGRWPSSGGFLSAPGEPLAPVGMGVEGCAPGDWGNWLAFDGGNQCQKFIMGTTKDASSNPIGGAIVQAFVTSTDTLVSETASDDQGRYESGTTNAGVGHYLVAYIPGAPDRAGTTVNTLIPTNRDGT